MQKKMKYKINEDVPVVVSSTARQHPANLTVGLSEAGLCHRLSGSVGLRQKYSVQPMLRSNWSGVKSQTLDPGIKVNSSCANPRVSACGPLPFSLTAISGLLSSPPPPLQQQNNGDKLPLSDVYS